MDDTNVILSVTGTYFFGFIIGFALGWGTTPKHTISPGSRLYEYAEKQPSLLLFRELNYLGADFNCSNLLHREVSCGNYDTVNYLIDHCNVNIDLLNREGNTPLHVAIYSGNVGMVEILLNHGVDVYALDTDGNSAFQLAVISGDYSIIDLLSSYSTSEREETNDNGDSGMHIACRMGVSQKILKLLDEEYGYYFNSQNKNGQTPLHIAVSNSNIDFVRYIIDTEDGKKAMQIKDICGRIPLDIAKSNKDQDIIKLLS